MKFRIYFIALILTAFLGVSILSVFAQDDESEDEIIVETMTVHANSPSDSILTLLKYSYSDYILKNKRDRTFDLTVKSFPENKIIENFINQDVSNIAISRILTKTEIEKFVKKNNKFCCRLS